MDQVLKIPLRAVLYKEDGEWFAHCLEFNLIGDGSNPEEALDSLSETIWVQIEACVKHNAVESLFRPASGKYFRMFAAGKNVVTGTLEMKYTTDEVTIEGIEARQFSNFTDSDPELCLN